MLEAGAVSGTMHKRVAVAIWPMAEQNCSEKGSVTGDKTRSPASDRLKRRNAFQKIGDLPQFAMHRAAASEQLSSRQCACERHLAHIRDEAGGFSSLLSAYSSRKAQLLTRHGSRLEEATRLNDASLSPHHERSVSSHLRRQCTHLKNTVPPFGTVLLAGLANTVHGSSQSIHSTNSQDPRITVTRTLGRSCRGLQNGAAQHPPKEPSTSWRRIPQMV